MIQFQILTGKMAGQEIPARHFPFEIGRSPRCDYSSDEPGVWDRHLTIRLQSFKGFEAIVHEQALGTINDMSFKTSHLRNGDILGLGSLKLVFCLSATRLRGLRIREWLTWIALVGLFLVQLALIYTLPD